MAAGWRSWRQGGGSHSGDADLKLEKADLATEMLDLVASMVDLVVRMTDLVSTKVVGGDFLVARR